MDQFTREVDEEYRRERMAQLWSRYGTALVALVALVVVSVGGWTFWENRQRAAAEAASLRYYEAGRLIEDGRVEEGRTLLQELVADAPEGVAVLARMRLAAATADVAPAEGAAAFQAIAGDAAAPRALRDVAQLRAALLLLDSQPDTALPLLQSLAAPENAFRHTAREQLGLAALRRGDFEDAGRWLDQIAADAETPQGLRQRLEVYSALVAAGPVAVSQ